MVGEVANSLPLLWPKLGASGTTDLVPILWWTISDLKGRRCQKVWGRCCKVYDASNVESLLSMFENGIPL